MKKALGQILAAAVLFGLGLACWTAGGVEEGLADAHEALAVLRYDAADARYDALEDSAAFVPRIPGLTDSLVRDLHGYRAAATYWRGRYDVMAEPADNGDSGSEDPAVMTFAANAGYRNSQQYAGEREALLRRLDAAVKTYADLVAKSPGDPDVAYNYEYIVRLRDTVSKTRPGPRRRETVPLAKSTAPVMAGDLPEGRTLHGTPGAPPPDTDMSQFKMHIPIRPEEREENEEAGEGGDKARKG
jgi:hypothetical protein